MEDIRKVIKFDSAENKKEEKPQEAPSKKPESGTKKPSEVKLDNLTDAVGAATATTSSREDLEMKRTILQNMKDFDFQIKKNQEDVTKVTEKLDSLSKDLDDLVSLYEIVSEQMNPFVGLSKVTKKRIEALETFTKEIDELKTRIGELEGNPQDTVKKTNDQKSSEKIDEPKPSDETTTTSKENQLPTKTGAEALAKELLAKKSTELQAKTEVPVEKPVAKTEESKPPEQTQMISGFNENGLSADVLDEILNTALTNLLYEQKMDTLIDEFIMSLNR